MKVLMWWSWDEWKEVNETSAECQQAYVWICSSITSSQQIIRQHRNVLRAIRKLTHITENDVTSDLERDVSKMNQSEPASAATRSSLVGDQSAETNGVWPQSSDMKACSVTALYMRRIPFFSATSNWTTSQQHGVNHNHWLVGTLTRGDYVTKMGRMLPFASIFRIQDVKAAMSFPGHQGSKAGHLVYGTNSRPEIKSAHSRVLGLKHLWSLSPLRSPIVQYLHSGIGRGTVTNLPAGRGSQLMRKIKLTASQRHYHVSV